MKLEIGKTYKTKNLFSCALSPVLRDTPYQYGEVLVKVEEIDEDNDYCVVIVDEKGNDLVINKDGLNGRHLYITPSLMVEEFKCMTN